MNAHGTTCSGCAPALGIASEPGVPFWRLWQRTQPGPAPHPQGASLHLEFWATKGIWPSPIWRRWAIWFWIWREGAPHVRNRNWGRLSPDRNPVITRSRRAGAERWMDADIGHGGGQRHAAMVAQRVWGGCQKYPENRGQIVMWAFISKFHWKSEIKMTPNFLSLNIRFRRRRHSCNGFFNGRLA